MSSVKRAVVRHVKLVDRSVSAGLLRLDAMCAAGASCPEVLASPMGVVALDDLKASVATAHAVVSAGQDALVAYRASAKAVVADVAATDAALRVYERAVDDLADGDAAIIAAAGLPARAMRTPPAALGAVTAAVGKAGRLPAQAILAWPAVKGATSYAVEVSFTIEIPDGTWTALTNGSRLRRIITAPAPGAQLLARVAAVDAHGNQSAWSPPILVTAR